MAGQIPAAVEAALLLSLQVWEALIFAKYMNEACEDDPVPCPTCNSPKPCKNYFCLECKTGGLCPAVFRGDDEHCDHPWLQVRHYTRQYSVVFEKLAHFMSKEGLKHIHSNKLKDGHRHCNLRSKQGPGPSSSSRSAQARAAGEKRCQGCLSTLRGSKRQAETILVCSLECLLRVARNSPELNLLAMNEGAMDPMEPPLFFNEKKSPQPPRMLETPTKTPVDEAPPSPQAPLLETDDACTVKPVDETDEALPEKPVVEAPPLPQATGDSQVLENDDARIVKPVVEAPPSPQAPGDSPKVETHEALTEEPVVEAPPLPQATGDLPKAESDEAPTEEPVVEAPSSPQATGDSQAPPAVAEDTMEPETFLLPPPEFEDLYFGPEWEMMDLESMV